MMKTAWLSDPPRTTNPLRFLLYISKPYRSVAFFASLAVVIAAILSTSTSYVYKLIVEGIEEFAKTGSSDALMWAAVIYIVVSVASELMWRTSGFVGMYWATGVRASARYALSSYAIHHSHRYFSDRFAGSISSKITHAANKSRELVDAFMWEILAFVVGLATAFVIAFITNPVLGWVFVGWVLVILPFNIWRGRIRVPLTRAAHDVETELGGATVDMLTNISAVQEYVRRDYELSRLRDLVSQRRAFGIRNWSFGERTLLANGFIQNAFEALLILGAAYYVTSGALSAGDMIVLLTIVLLMGERMLFISAQINRLTEAWGEVQESLTDIITDYDVVDVSSAIKLQASEGRIEFQNVSFQFTKQPVFSSLDLTIEPNTRLGLVGRSGAGKSTFIKLLLRQYDIQSGRIVIDGQDVSTVTLDSLRESIAIVPQEPILFHRTILENIAYGNPDASEEEVYRAAKQAQADEFIRKLPDGYQSLVGERGVKLSGGQRQRIAIARAFLKQAPILILDEATSSLDSESEVAVQAALLELMKGRTVLAIAHRLSTLRAMDRIIVMEHGRIVEDGSHDRLVQEGGLYARLWSHQAGGFLAEEQE